MTVRRNRPNRRVQAAEWYREAEARDLGPRLPRGPATWPTRGKNALTLLAAFSAITLAQTVLWTNPRSTAWVGGHAWTWLGLIWCLPLPIALFMIAGFLSYKRPNSPITAIPHLVCFRFVSRGENAEVLKSAISSVHACMRQVPLFPYVVEVVTDSHHLDLANYDVRHYMVPHDYVTPNGTLYKARALNYAVEQSGLPDDAWIMHCDEESHATPSLISGIAQAVLEEETTGRHRIGQGVVLYHNERQDHPFMMMADMTRTGDDVARFAFQCRVFGIAVFGFHGSFILVRNNIAKDVGYDFGPKGSVTEDAFWALAQMDRGRRCRFVDGYMVEQAPQSVEDFLKQRRRWFLGLVEAVRHAPARLRFRLPLACCIGIWSLTWLTFFYTVFNVFIGYRTPLEIRLGGNLVFTAFVSTYLIGQRLNLENNYPGFWRALAWMSGQLVMVPVASALESAGVVYGFLKPDLGFHVIAKNPRGVPARPAVRPHPALVPAGAVAYAATSSGTSQREEWAHSAARWLRDELSRLEGAVGGGFEGGQGLPKIGSPMGVWGMPQATTD
jgi:egghead protein (zeste-white 4 protein)